MKRTSPAFPPRPADHDLKRLVTPRLVARMQGIFYFVTGAWSWLSPDTFEAVTGPKVDFWLAQTVGALLCGTAIVLIGSARRGVPAVDVARLGLWFALILGACDVYALFQPGTTLAYAAAGGVELLFILGWALAWNHYRDH